MTPVVLKNCTASDRTVHQPGSESILLHSFLTGYMKAKGLVRRWESDVLHAHSLWLKSVSHHPTAIALAWSQAVLPAPPRVPSELAQGAWQLLTGAGAPPYQQPQQVPPLTKGDEPCMAQKQTQERHLAEEDHPSYPNISSPCHPSALCWIFCACAACFLHWIDTDYSTAKKKNPLYPRILAKFSSKIGIFSSKTGNVQRDWSPSKCVPSQWNHSGTSVPIS